MAAVLTPQSDLTEDEHISTKDFNHSSLRAHMLMESKAMAEHALAMGSQVPAGTLSMLTMMLDQELPTDGSEGDPFVHDLDLSIVHNQLAELVAPASPKTILLLATESSKPSRLQFLGPVRLTRLMMLVSMLSLAGFILASLSESVDGAADSFSLLKNNGFSLLVNIMFLLTAASLGASFYNLFTANRYIDAVTYDPRYESSYWVRYVLGVLSGTILGFLLQVETLNLDSSEVAEKLLGGGGVRPIVAMTGGFSASIFYRFLNQAVSAIDALVGGDPRDLLAAQSESVKARAMEEKTRSRLKLSAQMLSLQKLLSADAERELLREEVDRIQTELLGALVQPHGPSWSGASGTEQARAPGLGQARAREAHD